MPAQRHSIGLEGRVASAGPSEFLPARLAGSRQAPLEAPTLLDPLDLGRGRWLLVLEDASCLLTSAVVEEGEGFRRAGAGDGIAEELLGRAVKGRGSERFSFRGLGAVARWTGEQPIQVDQSNESIIVGGEAVVKRSVWTAPGNERPMVLPAHLEAAGFDEMPAPSGNAGWQHADGVTPLASMTTYLTDARVGWDRLDHVGRIVERRRADVADWIRGASDACLQAYRGELTARGASPLFDERLVRPLRIAQELHEFVYAARYLPGWRYVPDRALAAILDHAP